MSGGSASLYLIEILHQTTTPLLLCSALPVLYLIEILHQTTTQSHRGPPGLCCILSKFYIKPQPSCEHSARPMVVSYRNSTSNHNAGAVQSTFQRLYLIEILHQTTTAALSWFFVSRLYLIEILHQTTTAAEAILATAELYLIEILHQTTTLEACDRFILCCILSKFYIKPQQSSNPSSRWKSCILSKFYIKPQLLADEYSFASVVSYRNSTSNHNPSAAYTPVLWLYLIEILHQTTTAFFVYCFLRRCILSKFYIKPQLFIDTSPSPICCILSKFYIKPQLKVIHCLQSRVVSYRNSTSNHNRRAGHWLQGWVVSYRNSTSNHNAGGGNARGCAVVSYRNSTSNHNRVPIAWSVLKLYLIEILHQTTTSLSVCVCIAGCILSKFYIKPQHFDGSTPG